MNDLAKGAIVLAFVAVVTVAAGYISWRGLI